MTMMTETSREDEHGEDAMVHRRKTRLARGVIIVVVVRRLARRADRPYPRALPHTPQNNMLIVTSL